MERTTMNYDDTTPRSGAAGDDGAQAASERTRRTRAERSAGGRTGGSGDAGSSSGAGSGAGAAAAADGGAAGGRGLHLGRLFNGDRVLWIIIAALSRSRVPAGLYSGGKNRLFASGK